MGQHRSFPTSKSQFQEEKPTAGMCGTWGAVSTDDLGFPCGSGEPTPTFPPSGRSWSRSPAADQCLTSHCHHAGQAGGAGSAKTAERSITPRCTCKGKAGFPREAAHHYKPVFTLLLIQGSSLALLNCPLGCPG